MSEKDLGTDVFDDQRRVRALAGAAPELGREFADRDQSFGAQEVLGDHDAA